MKNNHNQVKIFIGVAIYVVLLLGYLGLAIAISAPKDSIVFYDGLPTEYSDTPDGEFSVSLQNEKSWIEGLKVYGGQFDLYFYNYTDTKIRSWTFYITVPAGSSLDDQWNANFTIGPNESDSGTFIITATDDGMNPTILTNNSDFHKMGFILKYTPTDQAHLKDPITHVKVEGIPTKSYTASPVFWILTFISLVVIFTTCLQLALQYRTKQYRLQKLHDETIIVQSINTFVNFIDAKDPYTKGHSTRVAAYAKELGAKMHLNDEEEKYLYFIALMHDVGKVSIPDAVLQKPGKLTPEERKVIESHTSVGGEMLKGFTAIPGIVSGALYHHERYDGTGYPQGLAGEDIPLYARIICVADSYDAMSSRRCYRSKLSYDEIVRELANNSGKQFDPVVCKIMLDLLEDAKRTNTLEKYNL